MRGALAIVCLFGCGRLAFDELPEPPPDASTAPVANAGADQTLPYDSPTSACVDPRASFDPDGAITCEIAFDSGSTSGGSCSSLVCFQAFLPGIYPVVLTVTDSDGNTATDQVVFTILAAGHPPPSDGLTRLDCGADQTVAVDTEVVFDFAASWNADPVNFRQYAADFGDGASSGSTALITRHTYTAKGTYTVIYQLENVTIPLDQWPKASVVVTVN